MKKIYMISSIVVTAITFLVFKIMLISEGSSSNTISIIFSLIAFCLSFPSIIIAKKIIELGNKIRNPFFKIAYYIVLPIALVNLCFYIYLVIIFICFTLNVIDETWGNIFLIIFISMVIAVAVILPSIQAIIISILKKIIKE